MARPQPIDFRQEMREHQQPQDRSQDWQALRNDLLDLLKEVDRQEVAHDGSEWHERDVRHAPRVQRSLDRDFDHSQHDRHRRALHSVAETLERFSGKSGYGSSSDVVTSAVDQIRAHHDDIPNRRATRTQDYQSSVHEMSKRLENLGQHLKNPGHADNVSSQDITNQLSQLTHTVELLAGAVGESGQVKRLETQIAGLANVVATAPEQAQTEVNQRLDRIASTIEQLSDAQYQLADRPVTMIEELSGAQEQGFDAVEAGVRGIYDRIDALEQNIGINPSDIDRLSADMAELARAVQTGVGEGSLLAKIDALNTRMNGIEDGGAVSGVLGDDVETLRQAVRDAVEPRFHEINSKIDTLDGKIKSKNGTKSVDLEDHIRQLIARMDQTGSQLSELAQYRSEKPDGSPDLAALAELVADRTSKAVSQSTKSTAANARTLDERVHQSIQQVDARLARLEETLKGNPPPKRKVAFVANKPADGQGLTATKPASAPQKETSPEPKPATQKPAVPRAGIAPAAPGAPASRPPARNSDPADAMRVNPADDKPLIDPGFGQPNVELTSAPAPAAQTSAPQAPKEPIPRIAPSGFDPNAIEPPRQPRSSFADDSGSTFAATQEQVSESNGQPETATNRNTFIEAARRAAQKHNADLDEPNASLLSRMMDRLRPHRSDEAHIEDHVAENEDGSSDPDAPAPSGIRARLARFGRKSHDDSADLEHEAPSYHMEDAYQGIGDAEDDAHESFLSRHKRPLMLAGLVLMVSLLALNLVQRRAGSEQTSGAQNLPTQVDNSPAEPIGMLSQPLLDPQPTGSIDPFVRQIPGTGMLDQQMSAPLGEPTAELQNGPQLDALQTGAFTGGDALKQEMPQSTVPAQLKFELPPEAIGPVALREAAAQGDPRAQFEVAAILNEGRAVPANPQAAAKWYERAAAQGFAPAEYRIGNIYEHGLGVAKDVAQAKIWYERAAQAGNRMSMHNLAALYASGALGKQQFNKAAEWFERAAGLGLTDSQFNLGMLHARGLGVPQDMSISYKWFSLAAARGDDGAAKARDDVARSLDADTISRLRAQIADWKPLDIDLPANFAPIGTWAENFNPGNTIGDKNVIKEVQSALNRLGYDVGTPDGLMGPRTRDAIATFERSTGMNQSGAVNPRLLAVLGSQPV